MKRESQWNYHIFSLIKKYISTYKYMKAIKTHEISLLFSVLLKKKLTQPAAIVSFSRE